MKRSQAVSLVLTAGAAAAAVTLAVRDISQREEDALIYRTEAECTRLAWRPVQGCREAFAVARAAYPATAPRYEAKADCERRHGAGACEATLPAAGSPRPHHVPAMAGVLLGRSADQNLPPQPVYRHVDEGFRDSASTPGCEGYATGGGATIRPASRGDARVRVAKAVSREAPAAPRIHPAGTGAEAVLRGGFGETGRCPSGGSGGVGA